ncbi:LysR family transcriptional regulator [Alcaligenaceae bacterium]|nr:LysR family transcriptional regulator [Alcaligenaceae bacterium]
MIRISFQQLEAFNEICRLGTFHAAANALNVTQPTISLRIREMESTLGVTLFTRRGRQAVLTDEGALVAQYASRSLLLMDEMINHVRTRDPLASTLRLGTSDMIAITCLPEIIRTLEATHPLLKIEVRVTNSIELARLVNEKQLDIALLSNPRVNDEVKVEHLALAELSWMGAASRHLPKRNLKPRDLDGVKVLTVPEPNVLSATVRNWCAAHNVPMLNVSTCNSVAVIARLIATGVAVSVLPTCVLHREITTGLVHTYHSSTEFEPVRICAAFQQNMHGPSIRGILRATRQAMRATGLFRGM